MRRIGVPMPWKVDAGVCSRCEAGGLVVYQDGSIISMGSHATERWTLPLAGYRYGYHYH